MMVIYIVVMREKEKDKKIVWVWYAVTFRTSGLFII